LLGEDEKASVMELTTSWKEEGIEIGRGQGIEIGRGQGIEIGRGQGMELGREREYLLLLRQLRKRFGALEPGWEEKIRKFSFDQLEELGEAFIDFTSPQDLRNWLATR
jgi:flagellar biosynthesis/type III secretory pathway protein FliH